MLVRRCLVILLIMIVFSTCSSTKSMKNASDIKPLTKDDFFYRPFGYEPNQKNFSTNLPASYRQQTLTIKNRHNPAIIDTIFRFYHRKNELFVYKTKTKKELFMAGNIYDSKLMLRNGIRVGMTRGDFYKCFKDLNISDKDTLRLISKQAGNSFHFIFRGNKLNAIKIDNDLD